MSFVAFNVPLDSSGEPNTGQPDDVKTSAAGIEQSLILAAEHSGAQALIQVSLFQIDDTRLTRRLVLAATQSGAHVEVLLDGKTLGFGCTTPNCLTRSSQALEQLNTINKTDPLTWLRTCNGIGPGQPTPTSTGPGCLGQAMNHNKFFLFSQVASFHGMSNDVVLQSSANDTSSQTRRADNYTMTIGNDPSLYQDYQDYFERLTAAASSTAPTSAQLFTAKTGTQVDSRTVVSHDLETWKFPRAPADDPVARVLGSIRRTHHCRNVVAAGKLGPQHTEIDAAIADVQGRARLLHRLRDLADSGCRVRMVYASMSAADRRALQRDRVQTYRLCTVARKQWGDTNEFVHSKYLLIDGTQPPLGANRRVTYIGSENWTDQALSGADNIMTRYVETADRPSGPKDSPIFDAFEKNFRQLLHASKQYRETAGGCRAAAQQ